VAERRVREPSGSSIKDTTDEEPGTLTVFAASSPAVVAPFEPDAEHAARNPTTSHETRRSMDIA
jgi:hypothetical protein